MEMMFVPLPAVPKTPAGPAALPFPPCAWIPLPLGKLEMMLLAIVALVTLAIVVAEPKATKRIPEPFDVAVELERVIVLLERLAWGIVPLRLKMSTRGERALA